MRSANCWILQIAIFIVIGGMRITLTPSGVHGTCQFIGGACVISTSLWSKWDIPQDRPLLLSFFSVPSSMNIWYEGWYLEFQILYNNIIYIFRFQFLCKYTRSGHLWAWWVRFPIGHIQIHWKETGSPNGQYNRVGFHYSWSASVHNGLLSRLCRPAFQKLAQRHRLQ